MLLLVCKPNLMPCLFKLDAASHRVTLYHLRHHCHPFQLDNPAAESASSVSPQPELAVSTSCDDGIISSSPSPLQMSTSEPSFAVDVCWTSAAGLKLKSGVCLQNGFVVIPEDMAPPHTAQLPQSVANEGHAQAPPQPSPPESVSAAAALSPQTVAVEAAPVAHTGVPVPAVRRSRSVLNRCTDLHGSNDLGSAPLASGPWPKNQRDGQPGHGAEMVYDLVA